MEQLSLYSIFQSNMVLQRQKPISVWGSAPLGSNVTVKLMDSSVTTPVKADGSFFVVLPAKEACESCTLTVLCDKEGIAPVVLTNISIGDVWLACGQSNMEFFLRYDKDWDNVKQYEKNPQIHVYNVPQTAFEGHKRGTPGYGRWMQSDDPDFETFSAPGYSFARNIQPHIQVPIGIIGCNWGGTTAVAWLDEKELELDPLNIYLKEYKEACALYSEEEMKNISLKGWKFEDSKEHDLEFRPLLYGRDRAWQEAYMKEHESDPLIPLGPYNINRPGGLYHLMLEPLTSFSVKGVLWYQGESDSGPGHAEIYDILMERLITFWRRKWNDDFPFLFVQLAPFGVWLQCGSENYRIVREKQELVSNKVPNTGMVSIMDIGSYYDIHPKEKMEVGRRLALLARGKVYGENICHESPRLISSSKEGKEIILSFNNCTTLSADGGQNDFVILQEGKEFLPDSVSILENTLRITSSNLTDASVTISLGYADYAEIHIFNEAGLPLCPFCITIN